MNLFLHPRSIHIRGVKNKRLTVCLNPSYMPEIVTLLPPIPSNSFVVTKQQKHEAQKRFPMTSRGSDEHVGRPVAGCLTWLIIVS